MQVRGGAARESERREYRETGHQSQSRKVLKAAAGADATVIDEADPGGQSKTGHEARNGDHFAGHCVERQLVHRGEDPRQQIADRHSFPRAHDRVREHHQPSRRKAHRPRKHALRVGDFSSGIRDRANQAPIGEGDGNEQQRDAEEAEHRPRRTTTRQPVVHDDEPADADHAAKAECEVLERAEGAAETSRS